MNLNKTNKHVHHLNNSKLGNVRCNSSHCYFYNYSK